MDYMLFFAVWIFGGLAFFALNRVQPGASVAVSVEEPEEESEEEEKE
jgi:single-stranded DNA-binding protein